MLSNGDFATGTGPWSWAVTTPAAATWAVSGGYSSCAITSAGTATAQIQLKQTGMPLVLGKPYVFGFDAWSDGPRYIEAKVTSASNTNYSGTLTTSISTTHKHVRSGFTMATATDLNSLVP